MENSIDPGLRDAQKELKRLRDASAVFDIHALAKQMQAELDIRDRTWRLRRYHKCFVGEEGLRSQSPAFLTPVTVHVN